MTPEALRIREFILNNAISEQAKNEILPLLGVIDTPGIKERIMQILEVEGKTVDLEESFLNVDIDNPQGNVQQSVQNEAPIPAPSVVPPVQSIPNTVESIQQVSPQVSSDAENLAQLEAQMQQLKQAPAV